MLLDSNNVACVIKDGRKLMWNCRKSGKSLLENGDKIMENDMLFIQQLKILLYESHFRKCGLKCALPLRHIYLFSIEMFCTQLRSVCGEIFEQGLVIRSIMLSLVVGTTV